MPLLDLLAILLGDVLELLGEVRPSHDQLPPQRNRAGRLLDDRPFTGLSRPPSSTDTLQDHDDADANTSTKKHVQPSKQAHFVASFLDRRCHFPRPGQCGNGCPKGFPRGTMKMATRSFHRDLPSYCPPTATTVDGLFFYCRLVAPTRRRQVGRRQYYRGEGQRVVYGSSGHPGAKRLNCPRPVP
jgi:hypothetical protein